MLTTHGKAKSNKLICFYFLKVIIDVDVLVATGSEFRDPEVRCAAEYWREPP